jgi:hypothetical protein
MIMNDLFEIDSTVSDGFMQTAISNWDWGNEKWIRSLRPNAAGGR